MSQNRSNRSVYVSQTVDGKRTWIKIGDYYQLGAFIPGKGISLIDWGVHDRKKKS
jgi:hypothetical protein